MEINEIIDLYFRRKEEREKTLLDFLNSDNKKFIVIQRPPANIWDACNTVKTIYENNIKYFADSLLLDWTDELPYLEPWIGTGVYANAFGCEYYWREDNAPDLHYRYHKIDELKDLQYPDYKKSPVMNMALETIDCLKEKTSGKLPIALTDTQSPFDTATLVLDAAEFFTACYTSEDIVLDFMKKITDLIIEFSRVQIERIGKNILAKPGHIMSSSVSYRGISISDDNLAVSSPQINEKIALPFDQKIADAFDGLAIHSCGRWEHTMAKLKHLNNILMIDCALSAECDPTPNSAKQVRDAMKGSGIITKVRMGADLEQILPMLEYLFAPDLKLIVQIGYSPENAEKNYKTVKNKLNRLYNS